MSNFDTITCILNILTGVAEEDNVCHFNDDVKKEKVVRVQDHTKEEGVIIFIFDLLLDNI